MTLSIDFTTPAWREDLVLANIVRIQFSESFLKFDYDAQQLKLRPGDNIIVQTERGEAMAKVVTHVQRRLIERAELKQVLRKANDKDLSVSEHNEKLERTSFLFALERIGARKLDMKLIRAQVMHDGSRIVFHFSAEGRIDFRDLVKDLAHQFRARIEMHQIGVRDGARMMGGIGSCGRELCCSTYLEKFAPVSIRMAKDQGLSLNPEKVSGMCGRLMCCLVYEQQVYRRLKKRLPRAKQKVMTEFGAGIIHEVDVVNHRVIVQFEDTNRKSFDVDDVIVDDGTKSFVDTHAAPVQLWDERPKRSEQKDDDRPPKKKRRRRRKGKGGGGQNNADGQNKNTQKKSGDSKKSGQKGGGKAGQKKSKPTSGNNKPKPKSDKDGGGNAPKKKRRRRRKPKSDAPKQSNAPKKPDPKN